MMNKILVLIGIALSCYTVAVLIVFWHAGAEPSTLTACLFGLATAEGGFLSYIHTTKVKNSAEKGEETPKTAKSSRGAGSTEEKL